MRPFCICMGNVRTSSQDPIASIVLLSQHVGGCERKHNSHVVYRSNRSAGRASLPRWPVVSWALLSIKGTSTNTPARGPCALTRERHLLFYALARLMRGKRVRQWQSIGDVVIELKWRWRTYTNVQECVALAFVQRNCTMTMSAKHRECV